MARAYPTLVGLGDGHCLVAFCLALLMGILYRKARLLSTVILFVERIRFQLAASSPSSQPPARGPASSFQLAGAVVAQEGRAHKPCAHGAPTAHMADLASLITYIIP